jgi:trypsin-like peptidase
MIARTALFLAGFAASLNGVVFAQSAADRDRAKSGVVMIRTVKPGTKDFGAGVISGVKDDEVYVVTAEHVVREGFGHGEFASAITVQFEARRGEWFDARRLDLRDPDMDLAVLKVALPPKLNAAALTAAGAAPSSELAAGTDVYPIGFKGEQAWSPIVVADKIQVVSRARVMFASQNVAPGNSGGALVDACGRVVGMVIEMENPSEARAIPIEGVLDALERWSLPTSLSLNRSVACGSAAAQTTPVATTPPVTPDNASGQGGRGGPRALRWRTGEFPPPNAGLLVFTIMFDGNPACASYNGSGCLWGVAYEKIDWSRIQPLVCGDAHRAKWGVSGYEDPKHWCNLAKTVP